MIGFFQKHKSIAILLTGFTIGGISIVLLGWSVIGMCVNGFCLLCLIAYVLVLHLRVRVNGGGELGEEVMALSHFQQHFSYIVVVSLIGGENHRGAACH